VREHWDGRDRWTRYTYDKKAKLISAEIDPGTAVRLDENYFNNSYVVQSDERASHNLAHYWGLFAQFLAQVVAWLT
jgi:hypothetical protein